ncbi:MAG: hypothetical protein JHD16_02470 [Solirubrobacteraceae bacterium]|nr:hypothetical protein [Solirubrobacteraceae bacterium]
MPSRPTRTALPWLLLGAFTAVLVAMSWRRWGNPASDPGLDLIVAAGWLDGIQPYSDVRYFYGPLGIGGLAASFAVLGTSLEAAFAFGFLQTAVIAELWRRLAGRWLPTPVVVAGLAAVLAIGFSGSLFNFQLPHTAGATTGLMAVLAILLAISHGRYGWAGVAFGLAALTRPEFFAFGVAALGGAALGLLRTEGWRAALRALVWTVPGLVIVGGGVLAYFASSAGAERLFTENLFPVDFVRTVGGRFEEAWHPYDLPSLGALLLRGAIVFGGGFALVRSIEAAGYAGVLPAGSDGSGVTPVVPRGRAARIVASPWVLCGVTIAAAAVAATVLGVLGGDATGPVKDVASDVTRLLLPMTVLPAVAFTVLLVAAVAWLRRDGAPLGGPSWAADLALIAVSAACSLRAYAMFSTDVYATYFAPPVVLLAAIVLFRAAQRTRGRQVVTTAGVLALSAVVLAAHAYIGRYSDFTFPVRTPHGTFKADATAGPNIQRVVDLLAPKVKPGEPMLVLPQEPGFQFFLGTRPALYDTTFLPGTLPDREADQAAAAAFLKASPRYVIVASRRFDAWGFEGNGIDVNTALTTALNVGWCVRARFGDTENPPASDVPPNAFTVYEYWGGSPLIASPSQLGYDAAGRPVAAPAPKDCAGP